MVGPMRKSLLSKAVTAICATVMCLGVTACGGNSSAKSDKSNSDSSSSSEKIGMHQIAGVTAKGELGKKPTVSFKTPMTVEDNSYVVLQKGDGAQIEDGDRVCSQGIAISVKDGSELASTWEKNTPDCSTVVTSDTSQMTENYYKIFKSLKLNSTVAFGVNDSNSSGTSYLMVLTLVSKSKDLKKATGVTALDVSKSLIDEGIHPPTMYFPLIVHEALMLEPTETEGPETLDHAAEVLRKLYHKAFEDAESMHTAPHNMPIGRPDEVQAARRPVLRWRNA